ncbi:MAG: hypothetical protein Q9213_002721 [Squamulea squamosa]
MEVILHLDVLHMHMNMETDEMLRLVAAPIPILLQSLARVAIKIFLRDKDPPPMCEVDPPPGLLPLWQLLDLQWCEAQAGSLYRLYSPFLVHYVSGIPPNNVNEDSYKTQHTQEGCTCLFKGPNPRYVAELIDHNRIPLVRLRVVAGRPELSLVAADANTKYVSLSHVWAGGLGNFRENRLPSCQLLKLHEQLSELDKYRPPEPRMSSFKVPQWIGKYLQYYTQIKRDIIKSATVLQKALESFWVLAESGEPETVCFWMDTLCIPVHPDDRALRIKAINNMNLIYAAAERCLVLDPELQQIAMKNLTLTQLNAHVLCSTWLTRSWTFQEARLSRAWYAQFADGFYNPNSEANASLHYHLYGEARMDKSDAYNLDSELISWYNNMPAMRQTDNLVNQIIGFLYDTDYKFIMAWNHLVSRSTSKMEDVNIILANTLDLSAGEVLALPSQQRMKAILKVQDRLPTALLFNVAHKIDDPSCRWVPWYPEKTRLSTGYGVLKPTRDGFLLMSVENKGNPVGFLVDPSIPRYQRIRLVDPSDSLKVLWITFDQEPNGPCIGFKAPSEPPAVAVMYLIGDLRRSLQRRSVKADYCGARFSVRKREGRTWHLVYEYTFSYSHIKRWYYKDGEETYHTVQAEKRTDEDAEFHIDCDLSSWPTLAYRRDTTSSLTSHGLNFYIVFGMLHFFLSWTPFYYLAVLYSHPYHILLPTMVLIFRSSIAYFEYWQLYKIIDEHAYKSWVKTFDEIGSLRPNGKEDDAFWAIGRREMVGVGAGMGVWTMAMDEVYGLDFASDYDRDCRGMGYWEDVEKDRGKGLGQRGVETETVVVKGVLRNQLSKVTAQDYVGPMLLNRVIQYNEPCTLIMGSVVVSWGRHSLSPLLSVRRFGEMLYRAVGVRKPISMYYLHTVTAPRGAA